MDNRPPDRQQPPPPPPHDDRDRGLGRYIGGSPLGVAFRLVLLSILVGVVLAAVGFDPWNIVYSIRRLIERVWSLGFEALDSLWRYFLLGAVIVLPVWFISRLFGMPRKR
ncbi:MAG TPA: DUF6460 domain-containing protein [Xanthobacteraceae bacterium]|nr:DUF6460 domain-containing protein [Xanthobacteraceae bacterium]